MAGVRRAAVVVTCLGAVTLSFGVGYFQNIRGLAERSLPPEMSGITVRTAEGVPQSLRVWEPERPLIVFVMSSVCRYCTQDLPNWASLIAEARRSGADHRIVSINDLETSRDALKGTALEGEALLFAGKEILDAAGTTAVPTVFVAGAEVGKLLVWEGVLSTTAMRQIEAALRPR